jgi:hypothetical protein
MTPNRPWQTLTEAHAGFHADWLLLQEIKAGRAPYRVRDAEVLPGDHVLMFDGCQISEWPRERHCRGCLHRIAQCDSAPAIRQSVIGAAALAMRPGI